VSAAFPGCCWIRQRTTIVGLQLFNRLSATDSGARSFPRSRAAGRQSSRIALSFAIVNLDPVRKSLWRQASRERLVAVFASASIGDVQATPAYNFLPSLQFTLGPRYESRYGASVGVQKSLLGKYLGLQP
jgi:hypothetical protein